MANNYLLFTRVETAFVRQSAFTSALNPGKKQHNYQHIIVLLLN
jgi:hypothetical protein